MVSDDMRSTRHRIFLWTPNSEPSHRSRLFSSAGVMSYRTTNTLESGSSTTVASAPSQPMSSPPKVNRHPCSQPVPAIGEWGARFSICSGSMFDPYAA